jgi:putative membrane protein
VSHGFRRPSRVQRRALVRLGGTLIAGSLVASLTAIPALAHGPVPADPPTLLNLALGWSFEPALILPLLGAAWLWTRAVQRVNAAHADNPVPRRRSVFFLGGLLTIAIALQSGIERYDTSLFSVHMVQHILLTLVAAPLIALGAPVTLLLRVATPAVRRRWILPVLHSRLLRVLSFPVVAWIALAAVMWGTHFSALFDVALENRFVHDLEHLLYLVAALLFWWPAVGLDPSPWRMSHPVRALYVFLQMPQNTLLAVIILNATTPLYLHYATLLRPWGPSTLFDQQIAAVIMWLSGDLLFIGAMAAIMFGWMRHEERQAARSERMADVERASIRVREASLAKRLAEEREGH